MTTIWASSRERFNSLLDGIVQRKTYVAGRAWNTYMLWVCTGVVIGTVAIFLLSLRGQVSLRVMTALVAVVAILSLALFKSTKLLGRSYPVLNWAKRGVYHFQIVALVWIVSFLWIAREPVLAYLDILVFGAIVYQAFLRGGCLMAGCCHGRPHTWGVCYGKKHKDTGYLYFLEEVRLFPIQLIEALWLFFLAAGALIILCEGYPPGESVSWYVVGYAAGRFCFEFGRADLGRVFVGGFSEPQWTAVLLTAALTGLEFMGELPFHWWHVGALFTMVSVMAALALWKRLRKITLLELLHPDHIKEVYQTVDWILLQAALLPAKEGSDTDSFCGMTSLDIEIALQVSPSEIQYRLSHTKGALRARSAAALANLIVRLKHSSGKYALLENGQGIYRIVVTP